MYRSIRLGLPVALLAAALLAAPAAFPATATLQVGAFTRASALSAKAAKALFQAPYGSQIRSEGFDGYATWNGSPGQTDLGATAVGSFTRIGDAGSGHSVVGDGARLQVRGDNDMAWGRYDTDLPIGGHWLDSNDNTGIEWTISGLGAFNALSFFVLDAADVGGRFAIRVGDTLFDVAGGDGRRENGNILFVRILLDGLVDQLSVQMMHDRTNDGFGIDGATVARVPPPAPVPLPAAAPLLGAGLGGLGLAALVGRRRHRRAA